MWAVALASSSYDTCGLPRTCWMAMSPLPPDALHLGPKRLRCDGSKSQMYPRGRCRAGLWLSRCSIWALMLFRLPRGLSPGP